MKELSIFIDESGDWGEYEKHCPYYIVTMVMHDQSKDIEKEIRHLEDYRLFQVADLACTLKLIELKKENYSLSSSEIHFFEDERTLIKNYLKPLRKLNL